MHKKSRLAILSLMIAGGGGGIKIGAWARMIKRVYGIDPLTCPHCSSTMSVIAFINEIERILRHLDCWDPPSRSAAGDEPSERRVIYDEDLPVYDVIDEPP